MKIRTPAGGKYTVDNAGNIRGDGEVLAPASLSDLFEVYGTPPITGPLVQESAWSIVGNALIHHSTFTADDPSEQPAIDTWAAQIKSDGEEGIRTKIAVSKKASTLPALTRKQI